MVAQFVNIPESTELHTLNAPNYMLWELYLNQGVIKNTETPGPILGRGPGQGFSGWERNGAGERQDSRVWYRSDHFAAAKPLTPSRKAWVPPR